MKKLTVEELNQLPVGTIFYYEEYDIGREKMGIADVVKVLRHNRYNGPDVETIYSTLDHAPGQTHGNIDSFEIANGRAKAIIDDHFMVGVILR